MSFEAKKQAALAELKSSKIWQSNYQPPFLLFMWWLGRETKPPHYNSFMHNALSLGSFFGLFWGVIMWLFVWNSTALPLSAAIAASLLAGALFGLSMAYYYRFSGRKNNLSRWGELAGN
ncbi:DUF6404 family protein [Idiomarina sp. PL1-037]|uniref:DUF6404 family protein n=1 Tax=Idiomarina sp. PL1-037 TaxID=3095365 RepID=UPI002ACC1EC2|nr:DUF6404 family protein [Idiomarina sp. PL1-037]WQC54098.1 DUF6404 family protein [Idiomarina sp. PL1-037]